MPLGLRGIVSGTSWAQWVQNPQKLELLLAGEGGQGAEWGWGALGASLGALVGRQSLGRGAGSPQMEL